MSKVFISYSHADKGVAQFLAGRLRLNDVAVWFDEAITGKSVLHSQIDENLKGADTVIVLWSEQSAKSAWVIAEAEYAANNDKLVSVKIGPCDLPLRFEVFRYVEVEDVERQFPIIYAAIVDPGPGSTLQYRRDKKPEIFLGLMIGKYRIGMILGAAVSAVALVAGVSTSIYANLGWRSADLTVAQLETELQDTQTLLATQTARLDQETDRANRLMRQVALGQRPGNVGPSGPSDNLPTAASQRTVRALPRPDGPTTSGFAWPVVGPVIKTFEESSDGHQGISIATPVGTPITAAADGIVALVGNDGTNVVMITHGDDWTTAYAYNSQTLVRKGNRVRRGQPIALSGTNRATKTPSLFFAVAKDSKPVDPLEHLAPR